jgi:hypothetical protein
MASFTLRSQRTGKHKSFSLLEILKLLGDTTNDEIWLEDGEDVYNLSSFQETGTGNTAIPNWSIEVPADIAGKDIFQLRYPPAASNAFLMIILNGLVLTEHRDFTTATQDIQLAFSLKATDSLQFIYQHD